MSTFYVFFFFIGGGDSAVMAVIGMVELHGCRIMKNSYPHLLGSRD